MPPSPQPTILVKKADGTTVRMTLDEVKKMRTAAAPGPVQIPAVTELPSTAPAVPPEPAAEEQAVNKPAGIPLIIRRKPVADAPVADKPAEENPILAPAALPVVPAPLLLPVGEDVPLLAEEIESHEVFHPAVVGNLDYDAQIATIQREAGIKAPPGLSARLQSIILSYLKGVRSGEQVLEYTMAAEIDGGLGLDQGMADKLLSVMSRYKGEPTVRPLPVAPRPTQPPAPKPGQAQPTPGSRQNLWPVAKRPAANTGSREIFHDIEPARPTNSAVTGPVEEMKQFNLRDWRRLGATAISAKATLIAKFAGWQAESFWLYRDTREAWLNSPLVTAYEKIIADAINTGKKIPEFLANANPKESLTVADVQAIIEINGRLAV